MTKTPGKFNSARTLPGLSLTTLNFLFNYFRRILKP
jgi:hypothetical protein